MTLNHKALVSLLQKVYSAEKAAALYIKDMRFGEGLQAAELPMVRVGQGIQLPIFVPRIIINQKKQTINKFLTGLWNSVYYSSH